ncbi:hypothetical protein DMENIID0001_039860 [Sergentomyia squamirostris]
MNSSDNLSLITCPVPKCGQTERFLSAIINHYKSEHAELIKAEIRISCVNKLCRSTFCTLNAMKKHIKNTKCSPGILMDPNDDRQSKTTYADQNGSDMSAGTSQPPEMDINMSVGDAEQEFVQCRNSSPLPQREHGYDTVADDACNESDDEIDVDTNHFENISISWQTLAFDLYQRGMTEQSLNEILESVNYLTGTIFESLSNVLQTNGCSQEIGYDTILRTCEEHQHDIEAKSFGVDGNSALAQLNYFHTLEICTLDVMHDFLEVIEKGKSTVCQIINLRTGTLTEDLIDRNANVLTFSWIKSNFVYKVKNFVAEKTTENTLPKFYEILEIFAIDDNYYFGVRQWQTHSYDNEIMAYRIENNGDVKLMKLRNLTFPHVFDLYSHKENYYIISKFSII